VHHGVRWSATDYPKEPTVDHLLSNAVSVAVFIGMIAVIGRQYLRNRGPSELCRWCGKPIDGPGAESTVTDVNGAPLRTLHYCGNRCLGRAEALRTLTGED
jgi:hypothetical protein